MFRRAALFLVLLPIAAAGCGGSGTGGSDAPTVVATTTQLADFARNIAPGVKVTSILSPNTDPHEYEVRPDDVKALASADIVLRSGGEVDAWLGGALDAAGVKEQDVVDVGRAAGLEGGDPHWWQDPVRAERAAVAIGHAFAAAGLPDRSAAYVARLRRLDAGVRACLDRVPAAERKLVTSHDALGYYARRYGITVIGAVIPALTTAAQPSAGDVTKLVDTIKREGVKTIFAESSVNPKVEEAIARETGAKLGPALWADSLGPKDSDGATYIASIAANTRALVQGFTGGAVVCPVDA
ncbi:metal ABC transporter substrate-binding protein [Solirubrobacter ginsenosidimutans]|uniref:Metal ABC transporter substrate-binding protein n=1 Tax=Solirubrobacter ginsenosidimutans TaxID=490573 RepID=A0A9X3MW12_9ACTN|nr:metal ABC transporter substrate-binding protein [Solirubrobacter ginsenosidimutans]MDA0163941.1 metal ABC transporter substrate-binding protein [Solirubrobacter ginsenosidimutans]